MGLQDHGIRYRDSVSLVYAYDLFLFAVKRQSIAAMIRIIGKTAAESIPFCRSSPNAPETKPTSVGPPEQPISPASAITANIAVPPSGHNSPAVL